jgi:predicted transcriptional regulator
VFTDSVIKHAKSIRRFILSSAVCLAQPHFSTLSKKKARFSEKVTDLLCVFDEDIWA